MELNALILTIGNWLAIGSVMFLSLTIVAFAIGWGIRFRLVGITSFTILLAFSCWAFGISYTPRIRLQGAVSVPIVFDNGGNLVVATLQDKLPSTEIIPTIRQLALNIKGSGRNSPNGLVHVRLRSIEHMEQGLDKPIVLAEAIRNLETGEIFLQS
ncbi:MAG TPA: Ycf51 family protein [Prochlorococcaceae cyanobacterium AMR_MDS_5431]|nr:Ycf51 family protein [Prochlorococcaceae cyanobacterium AMR_MDS_5431]